MVEITFISHGLLHLIALAAYKFDLFECRQRYEMNKALNVLNISYYRIHFKRRISDFLFIYSSSLITIDTWLIVKCM